MVEITPQKQKMTLPSWHWHIWLSFIIFFLSIFSFIFLKFYLSQVQTDIADINNKIKTEIAKVNANDESAMLRLSDSLNVFSNIAANHSYFSKFFDLLGSLTYARVVFTKVDADKDSGIVKLQGTAQNYTVLAKQMVALRENKNINYLEVKGINFGTNGLEFELILGVDPKIFTKQQSQ